MSVAPGLVLDVRGERRFVSAGLVHSVQPRPRLSAVPGSALGMAWVAGKVIPVADVGGSGPHLLLCLVGGEVMGLSGVQVLGAGFFERGPGGVTSDGAVVAALDLARELDRAQGDSP
jgi:hypothetical protein